MNADDSTKVIGRRRPGKGGLDSANGFLKLVISLRGGVRHWMRPEARTVPSAGLGFHHRGLFIDYAARFDEEDALGLQHRISIGLRP